MNILHAIINEQYRDRAIKAAGSQRRVSRWLNTVVLPAFFNPSGIEDLRQENTRLKGEVAGLRYALSALRPSGVYTIHEGPNDGQQYNPYPAEGTEYKPSYHPP